MHNTYLRAARVVLVIGLAIGGYFMFIRTPHVDRQQLRGLVISHTSVPKLHSKKPVISQSVSPADSSFAVVKTAAKTDPNHTGLYEAEWYVSSTSPPQVGFLLDLLPDVSKARAAFSDSDKLLAKPPTIQNETGSKPTRFTVHSVPGSTGIAYLLSAAGKAGGYTYTVDFRVGRIVVSELQVSSNTTFSTTYVAKDVQAEYAVLKRLEPPFSLMVTRTPLVATIVYVIVALAVAALAFFGPELAVAGLQRRRARHEEREKERIRSQYRARGRRAVQRHKAPAWRQGSRR